VYVTGWDFTTVAYNAATGAQRWVAYHNAYTGGDPVYVAASPTGTRVFVTGPSGGATTDHYATIAYNAATGAQLWVRRYTKGTSLGSAPTSVGI
jgi:outer membrane protein assembly factor BamB